MEQEFFIGAPVIVTASASGHDREYERTLIGQQGQIVDFGDSRDYDNIIVSFPDAPDFGAFNQCMLELIDLGAGI